MARIMKRIILCASILSWMLSSCLSPKETITAFKIGAATYKGTKEVIGKKMSEAKDSANVETTIPNP